MHVSKMDISLSQVNNLVNISTFIARAISSKDKQTVAKIFEKIVVAKLPIRLGQFLKLADIVQDGVEATMRIQSGEVMVNNEIETQRGRKLHSQDAITYQNKTWRITDFI